MSNGTVYIGNLAASAEQSLPITPYSRVVLWRDRETSFTAGDDTGQTMEKTVPWATQAMADNMLATLKSAALTPFSASHAVMDPAAELGDAVTVGGIYSQLCKVVVSYDAEMSALLNTPFDDEFQDEFPYRSQTEKLFGQVGAVRSSIKKTAEQIVLEVSKTYATIKSVSQISQKVDSIKLSVSNGETSSIIKLMAGEAEISSEEISMSGLVTFKGLSDGTTTIDGGCIKTGLILSNRIKLGGDMDFYETLDDDTRAGRLGMWNANIDGREFSVFGLASDSDGFIGAENTQYVAGDKIKFYGDFYFNDVKTDFVSDRRLKENINYDAADKLSALCDMLRPVTFERIDDDIPGRGYIGFIAQDIQDAAGLLGIGDALVAEDCNGTLILNHGPLTAALAAKVQQLDARLTKLEDSYGSQKTA